MIVAPYLINDNHWTVVLINVLSEELIYINPSGTKKADLDPIFQKISSGKRSFLQSEVKHALQKDSVNCGIFICVFMNP